MTHMVIFQTAQETTHHRCAGLTSAVELMERLRNEDGVESLELFELSEVEFEFRTYYHVALSSETDGPEQDEGSEVGGEAGSIESLYASNDDEEEPDDEVPSNVVAAFPAAEEPVEDELLEPLAPLTGLAPPSEPSEVSDIEVPPLPSLTASNESSMNDDESADAAPSTPFSDAIAANGNVAQAKSADDIFGTVTSDTSDDNPFASTPDLPPPPPPPEHDEPVQESRRGLFGR